MAFASVHFCVQLFRDGLQVVHLGYCIIHSVLMTSRRGWWTWIETRCLVLHRSIHSLLQIPRGGIKLWKAFSLAIYIGDFLTVLCRPDTDTATARETDTKPDTRCPPITSCRQLKCFPCSLIKWSGKCLYIFMCRPHSPHKYSLSFGHRRCNCLAGIYLLLSSL